MNMSNWKPKTEHEEKLSLDEVKFILGQGEKVLKEVLSSSDLIISRTTSLITVTVGALTLLVGFAIKTWNDNHQQFNELIGASLIGVLYSLFLLYFLHLNLKGRGYFHSGTPPSALLVDSFFDPYFDLKEKVEAREREKELYLTEIIACQTKISKNVQLNEKRWRIFNRSLKGVVFLPLVLILAYLICFVAYHYDFSKCHF